MDENERVARTVAEQRTGDENRWQVFLEEVDAARRLATADPVFTLRDILDWGERDQPSNPNRAAYMEPNISAET